ncbi:bifunctional UDP-N-acetylglucosamine diphosphorylase/glucosamine-1-phosphate N-acetyltransferase GlmU [Desulfotalea psychrophila]|uniref:Bifunctional protein GlmU n=1 Tax=Desulfotalea psychrophila (strain LSv54 / DSM 12343) TaxID=177439 RepID=GLMU_DESPS|nr:sugar phosphate nucleotidyltransferase [Desulfotalea psychrophila]Q6AMF9.1 RecName: Full=Bifunctional protein GlmU; Includes: RecName: Full=UDP-N-acetylglucosamine pyrophosphorylase; AltName: Full=N-acetylglucosamine-1-phosphate uridyltransferase; Includes: RecName: Full=Glucosamine-1-phosphate N-acetyltransferase [Desulfotalea psychrophila LSv54]CAG36466.1 related to UDP-N-acetylglucosamine pyrophosphorylase [Desulfotalea psychrophila LSv54]
MKKENPLAIVILAAGKGTRMKSELAKVLHPVFGRPMIQHVLASTAGLPSDKRIIIIGHQRHAVREALADDACTFVVQEEQLGTAHAVLTAKEAIADDCEDVMILCGDTPLISGQSLEEMYDRHRTNSATVTLMTTQLGDPTNYGRIISDNAGNLLRIVEEKDADPAEKRIKEINAGIYCVRRDFLYRALQKVENNNSQGELYLTDIIDLAVKSEQKVQRYLAPEPKDVLGVNSRIELAMADEELRMRRNREVMLTGVSMILPATIMISSQSEIGFDSLVGAGVELRGHCQIGSNCKIDTGAILTNCKMESGSHVGAYSVLTGCTVAADEKIPAQQREEE